MERDARARGANRRYRYGSFITTWSLRRHFGARGFQEPVAKTVGSHLSE